MTQNQLKFFDYEFYFNVKTDLHLDTLKDAIVGKILRPSFHAEIRSQNENIFIEKSKISYKKLTISYIDVSVSLLEEFNDIVRFMDVLLAENSELEEHIDFIDAEMITHECPSNFPHGLGGKVDDKYMLLTSLNDIKYLYVNNQLKAVGDKALTMSCGIYNRHGVLPAQANLILLTNDDYKDIPMNLINIKEENLVFLN
jgi:hypothetical protein